MLKLYTVTFVRLAYGSMTSACYFKKHRNYIGSLSPLVKRYKRWREDAATRHCPGSVVYSPGCTGDYIL